MRYFFVWILSISLSAGVIAPKYTVQTSAPVLDFAVRNNTLWAATADGKVLEVTPKGKIVSTLKLEPMVTAWGEKAVQKIMSIDIAPDGKTLILAGENGRLYLAEGGKIRKTSFVTKTIIKKILFVSDTRILLALLNSEVVLFDLKTDKVVKTLSIDSSPLSDMALSSDRKTAAFAGEAGIVALIDAQNGSLIRRLKGGNVDNIYKLDLQNNRVITAGQDRRIIVYSTDNRIIARFSGSFLIYAAALSPSGKRGAAAVDEENTIAVLDIDNRQKIADAKGHTATLNRIRFVDEKRFVSCADENKILFWEIP